MYMEHCENTGKQLYMHDTDQSFCLGLGYVCMIVIKARIHTIKKHTLPRTPYEKVTKTQENITYK